MPTQRKSTVLRLTLSIVALLPISMAGSQTVETAEDQTKANTGKPASMKVTRNYDTEITVYRDGSPVVVSVSVRKMRLGNALKEFAEFDVNEGPTLLQLRAGEMTLMIGDREQTLDEGEFRLLPAAQPLVVATEDDAAVIQYVSVGLR